MRSPWSQGETAGTRPCSPDKAVREIILLLSPPDGIMPEPVPESGSTAEAAIRTGRRRTGTGIPRIPPGRGEKKRRVLAGRARSPKDAGGRKVSMTWEKVMVEARNRATAERRQFFWPPRNMTAPVSNGQTEPSRERHRLDQGAWPGHKRVAGVRQSRDTGVSRH